jgi:heme/copper-type cytochrome/quinol oxidase subunit 2
MFAMLLASPASLLACTACYGKSDSPMARGMNWGIASLLVVVGVVLSGIATFFVYLARKSAASDAAPPAGKGLSTTNH